MADSKLSALAQESVTALNDYVYIVDQSGPTSNRQTIDRLLGLAAIVPGGRLTLTSGVPVTSTDVTGATSVFYTPYIHSYIRLWDGTRLVLLNFTEQTLALGTLTSGLPYDVFGFVSGTALNVELLAWTNGTTRATGLTRSVEGLTKTGDRTRLYLGTFYTTATTTTEDSGGGSSSQVGGKRFLFNQYNRVLRHINVVDKTANWSYTTGTVRQANAAAGNKVEFVTGDASTYVAASLVAGVNLSNNTLRAALTGFGLDTTTAFTGLVTDSFNGSNNSIDGHGVGAYRGQPGLGYHYLSWNESGADNTCTFFGIGGGDGRQSGVTAEILS